MTKVHQQFFPINLFLFFQFFQTYPLYVSYIHVPFMLLALISFQYATYYIVHSSRLPATRTILTHNPHRKTCFLNITSFSEFKYYSPAPFKHITHISSSTQITWFADISIRNLSFYNNISCLFQHQIWHSLYTQRKYLKHLILWLIITERKLKRTQYAYPTDFYYLSTTTVQQFMYHFLIKL